jgi:uncharacterized membrane protein
MKSIITIIAYAIMAYLAVLVIAGSVWVAIQTYRNASAEEVESSFKNKTRLLYHDDVDGTAIGIHNKPELGDVFVIRYGRYRVLSKPTDKQ